MKVLILFNHKIAENKIQAKGVMIPRPVVSFWFNFNLFHTNSADEVEGVGCELSDYFAHVLVDRSVGGEPKDNQCALEPIIEDKPNTILVIEHFLMRQDLNIILVTMLQLVLKCMQP